MTETHNQDTAVGPGFGDYAVPRWAFVTATMLERFAMQIRTGRNPVELAQDVRDLADLMERRI